MGKAAKINRERIQRNVHRISRTYPWIMKLGASHQTKIVNKIDSLWSLLRGETFLGLCGDSQTCHVISAQNSESLKQQLKEMGCPFQATLNLEGWEPGHLAKAFSRVLTSSRR